MKTDYSNEQLVEAMQELQVSKRTERVVKKALRYRNGSMLLGAVGLFVAMQLLLMIPLVVTDIDDQQIRSFLTCGIPVLSGLFVIYAFSVLREAACARAFIELLGRQVDLNSRPEKP